MQLVRSGRGVYIRDADNTWCYAWGGRVPGARDLTLAEALRRLGREVSSTCDASPDEVGQAMALQGIDAPVETVTTDGERQLVVGLEAPELTPAALLTTGGIARLVASTKAAIDSACFRGDLPPPQLVEAGTRYWSQVVVMRWQSGQPCGDTEALIPAVEEAAPGRAHARVPTADLDI